MELCRYEIRSILKKRVNHEHPDLWQRSRKHPKENNKRSVMRRCVVPLFANTDSDSDVVAEIDDDDNEDGEQEMQSDSSTDSEPEVQDEPVDRRAGVRLADTLSDSEETSGKTKREKFDSGVGDLFESPNENSASSVSTNATDSSTPAEPAPSASDSEVRVGSNTSHFPLTLLTFNICLAER